MKLIVIFTVLSLILVTPALFAQSDSANAPYELLLTPSLGGGLYIPLGYPYETSPLGFGFKAGLELKNLFFLNSAIKFFFNGVFLTQTTGSDHSFNEFIFGGIFGYCFTLADDFTITPLVGGGVISYFWANAETISVYPGYPVLQIETDLNIRLVNDFYLFFTPNLSIVLGHQINYVLGFNLGVAYSFHIPLPPPAAAGQQNTISLSRDLAVFSPNNDGRKDVITIVPKVTGAFESYELRMIEKGKATVKIFRGGNALPGSWTWDGRMDNGQKAADGEYTAELALLTAGKANTGRAESFIVDTKGIEGRLIINPKTISPDGDGVNDKTLISIEIRETNALEGWSLSIFDPAGNLFRDEKGDRGRQPAFSWDGRSPQGELVQSAEEYTVTGVLTDTAGNMTVLKEVIDTDIIVQRSGNKLKVIIPSIVFEGDSYDFRQGKPEQVRKNLAVLDQLAQLFRKYPGYTINIEGYALNVHTESPARMEQENREELLPLSQKRAEAIRNALMERGLDGVKIKAMGRGNAKPVVPYGDPANQWKNRRVEFILEK
jgi:outer membrane protein OmpA-like peptidoglycan-associated protein